MRLAHTIIPKSGQCGLASTAYDLMTAEKQLGHDVMVCDPKNPDIDKVKKCDFIIDHSGTGDIVGKFGVPIVHMRHGRPRISFLTEHQGGTKLYSYLYAIRNDKRFKHIVTFWKEHIPYWVNIFGPKVDYINCPVNLKIWKPGDDNYNFGGKRGRVNIVITDVFREDVDPFNIINALMYANILNVKVHVYGFYKITSAIKILLQLLADKNMLGEYMNWNKDLLSVYRSSDLLLTENTIDTRSVREAMACGCPVVRGYSFCENFTKAIEKAIGVDRQRVRKEAEEKYDSVKSAKKLLNIIGGGYA